MEKNTNSLNSSLGDGQGKDTNKERLTAYLKTLSRFPGVLEHPIIARSFTVTNYRPIFRANAIRRILNKTFIEPLTAATISKQTGLNHKYICRLKRELEKRKQIRVIDFGQCPTTLSKGVQFISSNQILFDDEQ